MKPHPYVNGNVHSLAPRLLSMQFGPMQAEYWRSRTERDGAFVEYGNDVEGSAFSIRDPLGSTRWNLQVWPPEWSDCSTDQRMCMHREQQLHACMPACMTACMPAVFPRACTSTVPGGLPDTARRWRQHA